MAQQRPLLRASCARSEGEFCVAFSEKDAGNPYSYIITYVEGARQPWSRRDVRRTINQIVLFGGKEDSQSYCALSDEGDLYFLAEDGVSHEKISGAGLYSDDAEGRGATTSLALAGNTLVVGGQGAQAYQLSSGGWVLLSMDQLLPKAGFSDVTIRAMAGLSQDNLYACAVLTPSEVPASDGLWVKIEEAAKAGDTDQVNRLYQSIEDSSRVDEGRLLHFNGQTWVESAIPERGSHYDRPAVLNDVYIETSDRIWAVGLGGTILLGNARDGFTDVSFHGDRAGLLSITKFRQEMIVASDYALHHFDGHLLSPLKPKINPSVNRNVPTPLKVQAVDDVLFYFDYNHGVHRWDGQNWEEIEIPAELLQREFNGLQR